MPSRFRRHDEAGHSHFWTVSCQDRLTFFWHDEMKQVVTAALRHLQIRYGVCLVAYVIMPEHVHVVLYPHARGDDQPVPISRLWQAFKQHVGFHGKERLRGLWREYGRLWSEPLNQWANGATGNRQIMETRGYDFNVDRQDTLVQKIDYCHKNPVTRGLVAGAEEWPWSSYRYYELDDRSVLPMDWDGQWPIVW
jgi:putative transposase